MRCLRLTPWFVLAAFRERGQQPAPVENVDLGQTSNSGGYGGCSAAVELRTQDGDLIDSYPSGFA